MKALSWSEPFRAILTFLVGLAGGWIFLVLDLPLPWMLGALSASMCGAILGFPIAISSRIRTYLVIVLGMVLGGTFSPEIASQIDKWAVTLVAAAFYVILVTVVGQIYCRFVVKMDAVTALFSATPGGLNEMSILGEEQGADIRTLTLTHAVRVTTVLLTVPFFFAYGLGIDSTASPIVSDTWHGSDVLVLVAVGLVGLGVGKLIRLPAYPLSGPLLASAVVHVSGLVTRAAPGLVSIIVQIAMGSALGARFHGMPVRSVGRIMGLAVGMAFVMLSVSLVCAALLSHVTGISFEALVLALAPGGFAEMALAALSMSIDPAFVTTHHALRLIIVVFVVPAAVATWRWHSRRRQ